MKVALVQMKVSKEKEDNLKRACWYIKEAKANGARLVILPEMFQTPYDTALFLQYAEKEADESLSRISATAKEAEVYVVAGSIVEVEAGKLYNTSVVFNDKGEKIAKHRKNHLFDIDILGGQYFKESDTLSCGEGVTSFEIDSHRFALAICFDIRFSDYASLMRQTGAEVFIYPAAFNPTTGPKHWELLFRSRANDNQVYTIGVSSLPASREGYQAYGHSLAVNPWGEVILDMAEAEKVGYIELDFSLVAKVRASIPLGH